MPKRAGLDPKIKRTLRRLERAATASVRPVPSGGPAPKRAIYPMPEVVDPGTKWSIEHVPQGGHVGRAHGDMGVPLWDTPFARAVRIHEGLHAGFSPEKPEPDKHGVQAMTLLAVEDARVNEIGCRRGFEEELAELHDPSIPPPDPRDEAKKATLFLIASHGTGSAKPVGEYYRDRGSAGRLVCNLAERATRCFVESADLPGFDVTIAVARMIDREFGTDYVELPPTATPALGVAAGVGEKKKGRPRGRGSRRPAWGELRPVEEPPRTIACGRRGAVRRHRLDTEGVLLGRPDRLLVDGRAFVRNMHQRGGTVLVDTSGSMSLEVGDLLAVIDAAPGATVACYDGSREGWGVLRVLVRAGWRVPDDLVTGPSGDCGNVVDGPALRWLAEQPGPRIWISDGGVTGIGDQSSPQLRTEAKRICAQAGIVRVEDAAEARRALRGGWRPTAAREEGA